MLDLILILAVVALLVYYWVNKNRHFNDLASKLPSPEGYPIIGHAYMFLGKPNQVLKTLYALSRKYRRMVALWIGPKFHVILFDARDIEIMFKDRRAMEKADEYRFLRPWLGDSILFSTGSKFRINKKIMMPTFQANGLKNHIESFNIHARKLLDNLRCEVGKEEFDIQNYLYHTMLGELLETTLGVNHDTIGSDSLIQYGIAAAKLCRISHIRSYKFWLRIDSIFRFSKLKKIQDEALAIIHPLTDKVISRRKEELGINKDRNLPTSLTNNETGEEHFLNMNTDTETVFHNDNIKNRKSKRSTALLDLLLESTTPDGRYLTDQEIKDEVLTIMFAGQDTTSATIGFMLSLLGIYSDVQDKVYSELYSIFGDSDRYATYEDLLQMEYLEKVMQETWRLYPPVPVIARKITGDLPLENYVLPKGCTVAIITMLLHRNPDFYDNPHKFDPDNFLPERIKSRHPYSYIPFSGGSRTCVGAKYAVLNIKVLVSTLLRQYRIHSTRQEKDYKLVAETTLKRREGFLIGLEPRNKTIIIENENKSVDNNNIYSANNKNYATDFISKQYHNGVLLTAQ